MSVNASQSEIEMEFSYEGEQVEGNSSCSKNILLVNRSGDIDGLLKKVSESKDQVKGSVARKTGGKVSVFDKKTRRR